jgi:hypothetical protein
VHLVGCTIGIQSTSLSQIYNNNDSNNSDVTYCINILQDTRCTCNHNIEERSSYKRYRGRVIRVTRSLFVSAALVIWHAKLIHRIILSTVACLAVPYFPTFHKRNDFRGRGY